MLFKKKPVVIEAFRLGYDEIPAWFQDAIRDNQVSNIDAFLEQTNEIVKIKTLEGVMTAGKGDFIVKGVKNEIYPCKEDIFVSTYDYVRTKHIEKNDTINNQPIYLGETSFLGNDAGDIIVWNTDHKIYSVDDENDMVNKIILLDKNGTDEQTIVLYEDGKRKMSQFILPSTFSTLSIESVDKSKVAYEFFRIAQ